MAGVQMLRGDPLYDILTFATPLVDAQTLPRLDPDMRSVALEGRSCHPPEYIARRISTPDVASCERGMVPLPFLWRLKLLMDMGIVDKLMGNCTLCDENLIKLMRGWSDIDQKVIRFAAVCMQPEEEDEKLFDRVTEHLFSKQHGGHSPGHSCSICGALDYKVLRACLALSVNMEQQALLLLPRKMLQPHIDHAAVQDLLMRGRVGQRWVEMAPRNIELGTTKCVACHEVETGVKLAGPPTMALEAPRCAECWNDKPRPGRRQMQRCSKCGNTQYCSPECQLSAWPWHKAACKLKSELPP